MAPSFGLLWQSYSLPGGASYVSFLATFLFGRVRATANAIVICMGFILGFVMSKTFVDLINAIHARYSSYLNLKVSICHFKFSHIYIYFGYKFPMIAAPSGCMGVCAWWAPSTPSSLSPRRRGRRLKRSSKCFPPVRKRGGKGHQYPKHNLDFLYVGVFGTPMFSTCLYCFKNTKDMVEQFLRL